jgi:hypothetical protein
MEAHVIPWVQSKAVQKKQKKILFPIDHINSSLSPLKLFYIP